MCDEACSFHSVKGNITISPGPNHSHKLSHCGHVRCCYFLESLDLYSCLAATSGAHDTKASPGLGQLSISQTQPVPWQSHVCCIYPPRTQALSATTGSGLSALPLPASCCTVGWSGQHAPHLIIFYVVRWKHKKTSPSLACN